MNDFQMYELGRKESDLIKRMKLYNVRIKRVFKIYKDSSKTDQYRMKAFDLLRKLQINLIDIKEQALKAINEQY